VPFRLQRAILGNYTRLKLNGTSFIFAAIVQTQLEPYLDRRGQIIAAALFVSPKRGLHQTQYARPRAAAGISVSLIYRYSRTKRAVISAMADSPPKLKSRKSWNAHGKAPTLLESLEKILFTETLLRKFLPNCYRPSWSILLRGLPPSASGR